MPRLAVYLLGPPLIERDGVALTLDRRKATALLAYLAVTGQSHRRDSLVNLLWPEYDTTRGRAALRRTLHALSTALGPDWLDVDREEIGLNPGADVRVDVAEFHHHLADCETHGHPTSQVCPACVAPLTEAVALVRGEFLSGFGLKDSSNFDDWQLSQAEALRRELAEALDRLVSWQSAQREFEPALGYARRRLALDPLDEAAHRQLMRLYAWSGRRSSALRQYDECVTVLRDQLGVPPQDATSQLHDQIQNGRAPPLPTALDSAAGPPSFLKEGQEVEPPAFVARERELAQLDRYLEAALAGRGQVVFVTGDAGCGKTALIQAFASRAQAAHPDLVVAGGHGNAHTGTGDPYLPFRELLSLLSGDVEALWAAGAVTREQARRLWQMLPFTVEALVKTGPDLIDLLVPGEPLLERARLVRPWPVALVPISRLEESVARQPDPSGAFRLQQSALFEQYTQVLRALASHHPLLLTLDDLQWADGGSVSVLFHLGRRLPGSRILIVGAYRPADLILGRPASLAQGPAHAGIGDPWEHDTLVTGRHPLEPVVNEFKRTFGQIEVDLEQVEGRQFVDALLDSESNRLGDAFREALYQRTQGHPLFTVELLRGMQERGDLVHDGQGRWVEGPELDWETLPARVEAVVAERIARLPERLQDLLGVASVEGETFTAEVVAQVQAASERDVVRWLSETLDRRNHLVGARGILRIAGRRLSQYAFRHMLYQKYLYHKLDEVERVYLHDQIGAALERLYGPYETVAVAVQLARHFQEAGISEKAIYYLHQAGARAVQLCAYEEAVIHLTQGLSLLMTLSDSPERARRELDLRLALGIALIGVGRFAREAGTALARARELGQQTGQTGQLCQALGAMAVFHYVRAEHRRGRELAEEALSQARRAEDPLLVAWSHWHLGFILFGLGEYALARDHLEQVVRFDSPQPGPRSVSRLPGADASLSALAYGACCLWCLGYPDQALKLSDEAVAMARELGHSFTLGDVYCWGGCVFNAMRRDASSLRNYAEELRRLPGNMHNWLAPALWHAGEAAAMLGQAEEGIAQMQEAIVLERSGGKRCDVPRVLGALAKAQAQAGHLEEGLASLAEALSLVDESDERCSEAELYRLRADLLLMKGNEAEAEASLWQAMEVARRQGARSWELRATTSLARLWQEQGRIDEARRMLAEIYGWFTEGFDTPDLKEARALLEQLSSGACVPGRA